MKTANEMFDAAFSVVRTPRSPEYKNGVLTHLKYKLREGEQCKCPYAEGTAAADAFWAGVTESWAILELHEFDNRAANPPNDPKLSHADRQVASQAR